ncbi:MAG: hypothetical protein Roseis3KO_33430 [Roseivirga sp.]
MEEKIEKLQEKVTSLTTTAKVLGTLAVIFGLGGGFGIKTIMEANNRITKLYEEVEQLNKDISNSNQQLVIHREAQQEEFDKYVDSKKDVIVFKGTMDAEISKVNDRVILANSAITTLSGRVRTANSDISSLRRRVSGIKLTAKPASTKSFGCGQSGAYGGNDLTVMYGSKDGTGCGVTNQNYFKTLTLTVPR